VVADLGKNDCGQEGILVAFKTIKSAELLISTLPIN
jgi:hypothetical protein